MLKEAAQVIHFYNQTEQCQKLLILFSKKINVYFTIFVVN